MGNINSARVDRAALLTAAQRYDTIADQLEGALLRGQSSLGFGAGTAGRDYADCGEQLRRAVSATVGQLRGWIIANREIAAALRVSAADYADIDTRAAARIG